MKVLIGCEESQAVCIAFRERGFEAYSCDLQDCSGGHPEWHLKMDVFEAIEKINPNLGIFHPPCTHLAVSGAAWFEQKRKDGRQQQGIDFFMKCVNASIKYIAIENPIGIMSNIYREPDQIIQPFYFGDEARKSTCLWLKNLPLLFHSKEKDLFNDTITHVSQGEFHEWTDGKTGKTKRQPKWYADAFLNSRDKKQVSKIRSKTFPGIAQAMATQWGEYLKQKRAA